MDILSFEKDRTYDYRVSRHVNPNSCRERMYFQRLCHNGEKFWTLPRLVWVYILESAIRADKIIFIQDIDDDLINNTK
jgi:hypothetical protein